MQIRRKGLQALAEKDDPRKVPSNPSPRLRRIPTVLDEAQQLGDVATRPGYRWHPLKGDLAGLWSISVSGNWRVVFRFKDNEVVDVDLLDYH